MRWTEEFQLLGYEMEWTTRYFLHQVDVWDQRAKEAGQALESEDSTSVYMGVDVVSRHGAIAYALRKSAMWKQMAIRAQEKFKEVNSSFVLLV